MFFIMGISNGQRKLTFDQMEICKCCGKYGHIEIYVTYMYFMFFFIPIFKWNKHYIAKMTCCGSTCELGQDLGKAIEKGEVSYIPTEQLQFGQRENSVKHCSYCGFTTTDDYQYCPKCGKQL